MNQTRSESSRKIRDMTVFAMLGALMFVSKVAMEMLPNLHLVGVLTVVYTIVYKSRALIPLYIYVLMNGVYAGFSLWWMPYLYIWTVLWGVTMLLPSGMPVGVRCAIYPLITGLHGVLFGVLYSPAQALLFGLDFDGMIAWIIAGLPFDLIHGVGNMCLGFLVYPLSELLFRLSGERRVK